MPSVIRPLGARTRRIRARRYPGAVLDSTLHDSVESLVYWRRRRSRLPWYRRSARREASRMVVAWERRLRAAAMRPGGTPLSERMEAGLAVARSAGTRWARRLGVLALAMMALASLAAGTTLALVLNAL
jgi:hypothetical protein